MKQYVDKSEIIKKIEQEIKYVKANFPGEKGEMALSAFNVINSFLDTLEVKESPTDAFIEKAVKFLKEWDAYRVCLEGHKDWFIEQFKKVMEE